MKKWLSLLLVLCLMLPALALGETKAPEASLVEITFAPGTLPEDIAEIQPMYTEILGALGFNLLIQEDYGKADLMISGESLLSFEALLKDESVYILSALLGDKAVFFTKDELTQLASSAAPAASLSSGMDISPEALIPVLTEVMSIFQEYLQKGQVQACEVALTDTITGTQAMVIALGYDEFTDIFTRLGQSIGKVEELKKAVESNDKEGRDFDALLAQALEEIPQDIAVELSAIMDDQGNLVCIAVDGATADNTLSLMAIINEADEQVILQGVKNEKEQFLVSVFGSDDDTVSIYISTQTMGEDGQWAQNLDLRFDITIKEENDQLNGAIAISMGDKKLITINAKHTKVAAQALPAVDGAIQVMALSQEETASFTQGIITNALTILQASFEKLPASLQALISSTMQ